MERPLSVSVTSLRRLPPLFVLPLLLRKYASYDLSSYDRSKVEKGQVREREGEREREGGRRRRWIEAISGL